MGHHQFARRLGDPRVWLGVIASGVVLSILMQRTDERSRQLMADADTRLNDKVRELKVETIGEACSKISASTGLKFEFDWRALHAAGLDSASPCIARLRDVKAYKALNVLGWDASFAWRIDSEGRVSITSVAADAAGSTTECYAGLSLIYPGRHRDWPPDEELRGWCEEVLMDHMGLPLGSSAPGWTITKGLGLQATPTLHDRARRGINQAAENINLKTGWFNLRIPRLP